KTEVISKVKIEKDGKFFDIKTGDTGDFQKDFILKEGKNIFRITSTDRAGNKSTYDIKAFFDSTPPKLSSPFPPDGKIVKEVDPLISVTISEDSKINYINMKINGKAVSVELVNSSMIKYKPEKLVEGTHNVEVEVENAVGLKDIKKWSFTVDSTENYGQRTQILGAIGQDVKDLQRMLVLRNYLPENDITGVFDQKTLEAVKKFQGKNGLEPDGVVGPSTIDRLSYYIVIELAQFNLALMLDGKVVKNYLIACGSPEYPTPTGEFIITNKLKDPTWIPPDSPWAKEAELTEPGPDNPLGTRWIELNSSLVGIHGTNYPETVGMNVSHGCVRMAIPDVEELYEYVNIGTRVTIRDPIIPPTPTPYPTEPQAPKPDKKPDKQTDKKPDAIYIEKKNY
ncbi:MAG: L,D-transpeptidase family protein, partial [Candidatus Eremiobacterota bacterium]